MGRRELQVHLLLAHIEQGDIWWRDEQCLLEARVFDRCTEPSRDELLGLALGAVIPTSGGQAMNMDDEDEPGRSELFEDEPPSLFQ